MIFARAAACAAILFSMLAIGAGPSKAGPPNGLTLGVDATCPANLAGLGATTGVIVGCWCPAGPTGGSVWGTAIYTIDSNLCHAARHAGLIGDNGGEIWARLLDGQAAYVGSDANGVTTSGYGAYHGSFVLLPPGTAPNCPQNMQGQGGGITCACGSDRFGGGTVWGSDVYTEDSAVCMAALHAGAVAASGGTVTITVLPGQSSYAGSTRNGVTTSNYGAWGASYSFAK